MSIYCNSKIPFEDKYEVVHLNMDTPCWIMKTKAHPGGYARISVNRKRMLAHRYSWSIVYGEIPEGQQINHKCDNRKCVNPEHLFIGTQLDNMLDMASKNRQPKDSNENFKLSYEIAREIRSLYATGDYSKTKLAKIFKVHFTTIDRIIRNRYWKDREYSYV